MRQTTLAALALPLVLVGCGSRNGESAADYAGKIGTPAATAAAPSAAPPAPAAPAALPPAAVNGRKALDYARDYSQVDPVSGARSGLTLDKDGTYVLVEDGKTTRGRYEWLSDGKRLRLRGVERRPIVLVADGALYRLTNENVPIDDVTPDRMYRPGGD